MEWQSFYFFFVFRNLNFIYLSLSSASFLFKPLSLFSFLHDEAHFWQVKANSLTRPFGVRTQSNLTLNYDWIHITKGVALEAIIRFWRGFMIRRKQKNRKKYKSKNMEDAKVS